MQGTGWRSSLRPTRDELIWTAAFLLPYGALFLVFVAWPIGFSLWLGSDPALYGQVLSNPRFPTVVLNTLLFAGLGVNLKMACALLLSGFFIRPGWWTKVSLFIFMIPWALPALSAFISIRWMLMGQYGFINNLLDTLFDIDGPIWFNSYPLAMGANILAYVWKWLPFWTLVFLAGRMAIPRDIHEAAAVDGAHGLNHFAFITVPLLANLYLICTLLATLWAVGDFSTTYFVSSGAPALMTEVLGTHVFRIGLDMGYPAVAVAAGLIALPVLVPIAAILIRRLYVTDMQL